MKKFIDAYWAGLNGYMNYYSEVKIVGSEMINIKIGKGAEQFFKY